MEILIKADMVTDAMVSTDCEIEDLNLMDRDYREFGDRIIYFIDTTEMGPGTAIPQCLLYKNVFPEYRVGGLRNSARIKENTSLAEVFRYVKLLLGAEPGGQTGYADIVSKLVSGVAMKDVLSAAFSYTGNLFVAIDLSGKILEYSTPFCVEATESLKEGADNRLIVVADGTRHQADVPSLNTDWFPYGGIYRSVTLVRLPEVFIQDMKVRLSGRREREITVEAVAAGSISPDYNAFFEIP